MDRRCTLDECILVEVCKSQSTETLSKSRICGKKYYVTLANLDEEKPLEEVVNKCNEKKTNDVFFFSWK